MSKKADFSLDNFKKWMEEQSTEKSPIESENSNMSFIGVQVEPKIGFKKLISKIEIDEGDEEEVCNEFLEDGGVIVDCEDKEFLVEVNSGKFYINRSYIRKI